MSSHEGRTPEPGSGEVVAAGFEREAELLQQLPEGIAQLAAVYPEEVTTSRPLFGSLPLDERPSGDGATTSSPVALFAPVHLAEGIFPGATAQDAASEIRADTADGPGEWRTAAASSTGSPSGSSGAGNGATDPIRDRVGELLAEATGTALRTVESTDASYDFDEYALLATGEDGELFPRPGELSSLSVKVEAALSGLLRNIATGGPAGLQPAVVAEELHKSWRDSVAQRAWNRIQTYDPDAYRQGRVPLDWWTMGLLEPARENLYAKILPYHVLGAELAAWAQGGGTAALAPMLTPSYWRSVDDTVFVYFRGWPTLASTARPQGYPFTPFSPEEPLFGLRVVHRQKWRREGYARGELVRTIPLAPKEAKRISVKITERRKTSRGFEETTSFETTTEQATTTKNSDEVVTDATSKLNKHAAAEVSGGAGPFFSAKVNGSITEDTGTGSKHTKTQLNELMSKTASRLRRDTKVTVTSELETGFEESTASELANPNDEVAITCLYHRLQERFRVHTEIGEVNSVVLVPELLPAWNEIDESWICDHADVIGRVLLDERYRQVLAAISTEPSNLTYSSTSTFSDAAAAGIDASQAYQAFTGGRMPDMLRSGQQFFAQDYDRRSSLELDNSRRKHQLAGLVGHVRRNILHYLRSIWAAEDSDQRIQRHGQRLVATAWVFTPKTPAPAGTTPLEVDGAFIPAPGSIRPLSDVIDPTGPIGWLFNCAIYRLRDDPKLVNLHQALAYLRATYARFAVTVIPTTGSGITVRQSVAYAPRRSVDSFSLEWSDAPPGWNLRRPGVGVVTKVAGPVDGALDVRGVKIWIDGTPASDAKLQVDLRVTPELEDPHLRLVQLLHPLPAPGDEDDVFTASLIADIARLFPNLTLPTDGGGGWAGLDAAARARVLAHYHRYLVLRETGRPVTVDTANLVLDMQVSPAAALEPFKRLHRYIDVLKEEEERRRRTLENDRRTRLLAGNRLGDPDIERVTVISDAGDDLSALDSSDDD